VSDFRAHSFDAPRERSAPRELSGHTLDGVEWRRSIERMTLVVAVKPDCDGCRDFIDGELEELNDVDLVIVSASAADEWRNARQRVIVSPEAMAELDIRSAPFYVLIDAARQRVATEGVVFAPAQVKAEITSFLAT
jgi:hypothetical protein